MEYIKKEELIEGEIYYVSTTYDFWMIGLVTKSNNGDNDYSSFRGNATYISKDEDFNKDKSWCYKASDRTYRLATSEEKHWLETCIKENKFVSYEEAMKSFIPEYVEWIDNIGSSNLGYQTSDHFKKNKIFKTDVELPSHGFQTQNWITHLKIYPNNYKPSTKEAYDAQFVVKEPEFVLPEKWCILRTGNNYNIINKWFQDNNLGKPYMNYGYIWKSNNNYYTYLTKPGHRTEITFEQFKKYVLKEETVEEKVIEPLPQFKVIETIETITKVENNEGNQFFIGDVVNTPANNIFIIKEFKYNVDKTNILAILNNNSIISIDKIEHYIEPKTDYKILEYKTEGGISCKAPFLANSHQFYINERCKIYSIKRISDDLIITVGDEVLSKTCGVPNKILSIELINNKIRLYPRNSFYNLEDIIKVKEETLLEKAKRLYPVGTKFINPNDNRECVIKEKGNYFEGNNHNIYRCFYSIANSVFKYEEGLSGCIYINNTWSKIIE